MIAAPKRWEPNPRAGITFAMANSISDEGPESIVLHYLRRIDTKVDRLADRIDDLTGRLTAVEAGLNAVRRDLVAVYEADARLQVSVDRQGARLDCIERRLDLRDL